MSAHLTTDSRYASSLIPSNHHATSYRGNASGRFITTTGYVLGWSTGELLGVAVSSTECSFLWPRAQWLAEFPLRNEPTPCSGPHRFGTMAAFIQEEGMPDNHNTKKALLGVAVSSTECSFLWPRAQWLAEFPLVPSHPLRSPQPTDSRYASSLIPSNHHATSYRENASGRFITTTGYVPLETV
jgi:hypothetical protein